MQKILYIILAIQLCSVIGAAGQNEAFAGLPSALDFAFGKDVLQDLIIQDQEAPEDEEDLVVHEITASPAAGSTASSAIEPVSHAIIKGNDVDFYDYYTPSGIYNAVTILDTKMMDQEESYIAGFQGSGQEERKEAFGEEIQRKLSLILNKTQRSTNDAVSRIGSESLSRQEDDIIRLLEK